MTTINRSDITKMHFHQWQCPICKHLTQDAESDTWDSVICESCYEEFEVIEGK